MASKRRRARPEQDEYEFECGKCKHIQTVKENENVKMVCPECGFTGFNVFRLLSEEDAELEEQKKKYIELKRTDYDQKIAELQAGGDTDDSD